MSKNQTPTTIPHQRFVFGNEIYANEVRSVLENGNFVAGYWKTTHLNLNCGLAGQVGSGSQRTLSINPTGSTLVKFLETDIWSDPDAQSIGVASSWYISSSNTIAMRIDYTGSLSSGTIFFTGTSANSNQEIKFLAPNIFSGSDDWINVKVYAARTAGAGTSNHLKYLRLFDVQQSSSLPDPQND